MMAKEREVGGGDNKGLKRWDNNYRVKEGQS